MSTTFLVEIHYREPTYEARVGPKGLAFRWSYRVAAGNGDLARLAAINEFRRMERLSGVGWARVIEDLFVRPATTDDTVATPDLCADGDHSPA
jgi:hypothetical protein